MDEGRKTEDQAAAQQAAARVFMYNGQKVADDPGLEYSIEDVRQSLTQFFPELAQATHTMKDLDDGTVEVTFAKRAGTKG